MKRAKTVNDFYMKVYKTIAWSEKWKAAFGEPETTGMWIVWGNSANGKTSFVMQMIRELCINDKVVYNSLEEGFGLTMKQTIKQTLTGLEKRYHRNLGFVSESMSDLNERLNRRRSARVVVIDSFQYTELSYKAMTEFVEAHPTKLFVVISQADGKQPLGRAARSLRYYARQKIFVEGYRAHSLGRINSGGIYTIWEERAHAYWSEKDLKTKNK